MNLEQTITRYRHLDTKTLAEKIETELGLKREYRIRDSLSRPGISITTREQRPFSRYVSDWVEMKEN